ncbi:hypothetical protein A3843_14740 [Pseudovibrio exalbescens]|uniref:Uncharacterized protein n=1 Tax=Pseudovibrio exalbescens TaxID=197461 RepID=A0A1U7JE79_9HYPH|nr:hypothetical protein A3843_14740 [Pseudovibrio exalbescens]
MLHLTLYNKRSAILLVIGQDLNRQLRRAYDAIHSKMPFISADMSREQLSLSSLGGEKRLF